MHLHAEQLAVSSGKWMEAALAAFSNGPSSEDLAVHHAGVATEHLLKAFLAGLHPSLIVDGRDFNSLLYAAGHGGLIQIRGPQVKTIQLGEAYDRAQKILKGKIPPRPKVWPLADARNGVAHAGYHDRAEVQEVFTSCIKVIDPLLVELEIGPDYWGVHKGLHDKLLIEGVEAARVRLEGKLARGRRVFAERYGHIDEGRRGLVLAALAPMITPGYRIRYYSEGIRSCPACSAQGNLAGETFMDEARRTVVLTPNVFVCRVCELRVEQAELDLLAAPLGADIDLEVSPDGPNPDLGPYEYIEFDTGDPDYSPAYRVRLSLTGIESDLLADGDYLPQGYPRITPGSE